MEDDGPLPDYLVPTYNMVKCAYPDGVSEEEYWPVLAVLQGNMSHRTLAQVLTKLTGKHISIFSMMRWAMAWTLHQLQNFSKP